jgi:hypothetical protein
MSDAPAAVEWIIDGQALRVTSGTGRDSIIEAIRDVCDDPRFRPGLDLLIDARALERAPQQLSPPLVRGRAFEIRALGFRRCALVAAPSPSQVGLANMFATYADQAGVDTRVFTKVDEALGWLRITGQGRAALLSEAESRRGRPDAAADTEARLARILELLRTFLGSTPVGVGPIRTERSSEWTDAQRAAYGELRKEAGADEPAGQREPGSD